MPSYWIKLYVELLDDAKLADLPDWAKWSFIEFLLLAKDNDKDGELQPVTKMAWRIRKTVRQVETALRTLEEAGVVQFNGAVWVVTNFAKRQARSESADRVRRFREREKEKRNVTVTDDTSYSSSSSPLPLDSDSLDSDDSIMPQFNSAQTAAAIDSYNSNGRAHACERLYQQVTGQISIPAISQTQAFTDLQALVDHYGVNMERAINEGKEVFAAWCNTTGKSGKYYSRTNTGWLSKWLEKIAPMPDAQGTTVASIAERIRQAALDAGKART